ncbi:MAG: copper ion binding protein [Chloroflexi bacterium]|nr:copper ion binding protein [Chloroflexota bacterium]
MAETDAKQKITLPVQGMTCASCVLHVEEALKEVPGVTQVKVNLATEKAMVEVGPESVPIAKLVAAVDDAGYKIAKDKLTISVGGMTCASCVAHVEGGLREVPGVLKATVSLSLERATVEYIPGVAGLQDFRNAVEDVGYKFLGLVDEGAASLDRERLARDKEIRRQRTNLIIAWSIGLLVMIGTFQPYWFLPRIVPEWMNNKVFLFFLTTPIVLGPGRQFFINSWNGLRHGLTDMNLLYATGIGAAYLIAIINTFWPNAGFGGRRPPSTRRPPCSPHSSSWDAIWRR